MGLDITLTKVMPTEVHSQNITHNLGKMAREAGLYLPLWRPEEIGVKTAEDLIPHLVAGIEVMRLDPRRFEAMDAPNGWGTYRDFLPWLERLLLACREHPDADIRTSR